jgi:hypothetical protein
MKKHLYWLALVLLFTACSKSKGGDDDNGATPGNGTDGGTGTGQLGAGVVYYDWATEGISKVDLKTGVKSLAMPNNTSRSGFDVSRDNTLILESKDHPDDYDAELYTITNVKDNTIVSKFKKLSGYANSTYPTLSFDKTLILVPPTYDDGIMILDTKGNILFNLTSYQGEKLEGSAEWMPDNTFIFTHGSGIYRTNKEFTKATLIKTINFDVWSDIAVSPDGTKIALRGGNHLWMMNADGSNLTQITESNNIEVSPVFSPDSKYLLIGYDFTRTSQWGRYWYMAIIPADFQKYNLEKGADKRVIPFIPKGATRAEPSDGSMIWR